MRQIFLQQHACQSKIGNFSIAVNINKDIFGFDVPVDIVFVMHVTERETDLQKIKPSILFPEGAATF